MAGNSDEQEQLDEVEFLEAMSREGEFDWSRGDHGNISGTLNIFLQLESPIRIYLMRREKIPCRPSLAKDDRKTNTLMEASASGDNGERVRIPDVAADKFKGAAEILHLPPICLQFQLPPDYPSRGKPGFTLSCKWLNFSQLSLLCHQLDQLHEHDPGSVVLYNWQQFLANDAFSHLGISSELSLEFQDPIAPNPTWDPRAIQDMDHPLLMLPSLIEYDKQGRDQLFADSFFDCEICFLSLQGSKCIKTGHCGHIHCRDCLTAHVGTKISSGDVTKVDCPSNECEELLTLSLIKELVPPDVFERYDKLLLQRTLDGMKDVVYCPRPSCRCVTVKDEHSNMTQCPRCRFSFCVLCRRVWHGLSPCKLLPSDIKELRETWEALDAEGRHAFELQYGKRKLQEAFQEYDTCEWIASNAKLCPHCNAKIEKIQGCNKMTCTQCRGNFCWLCDAALPPSNPYSHFREGNSQCAGKLFEGLGGLDYDFF